MQPASAGSPFTRAEGPHDEFNTGIAYAFRLTGDYAFMPLQSTVERPTPTMSSEDVAPVAHALLFHLGASLSPLYWLNFELNFPFAIYEGGDEDTRISSESFDAGTAGQGDLRIGAFGRPITGDDFDLALGARFWAPIGSEAAYLGGEHKYFRFELVASAAGEIDVVQYGCTLGLSPLFFAGGDGERVAASCAAHFTLAPAIAVGLEPHLALFSYAPPDVDREDRRMAGLGNGDVVAQFEPLGAGHVRFGNFHLGLAGGPGIGTAPGTASARVMLSFGYADRGERVIEVVVHDADLDGIEDEYDACPEEAGPKERRGCPDPKDSDGDGIIEDDACPDEPGAKYDDPEANGCPDQDNDHFADPVDPCPTEPGPTTEGCPKYARLEGDDFVIKPPIRFPRRSAKLPAKSKEALIEVIRTMRANPKIEQVSLSIGTKGARKKLTNDRAATILSIFTDQSVDSNRFEVELSADLKSGQVKVRAIR
jgi:OOP family OmpA-OmpF porin